MIRLKTMIPLLAATLMLSACLAQPHPQKNIFSLSPILDEAQAPRPVKRRTLLVGTASAAAGFDNRALVYRVGPDQFESDFYNEFLAPPPRLLVDLATQYLDARNAKVRAVKTPGLTLADFGLETYLESLYGDFTVNQPQAVVKVKYTLNDLRGARPRILLDKTYQAERPFGDRSPAGLVAALNDGLDQILAELNRDIEKAAR